MRRFMVLITLSFVVCVAALSQTAAPEKQRWFKGNTHTHTLNSDGDSTPYDVVKWYREHGYNFVFITDHEYITNVGVLNELFGKAGSFVVISGQEVTDRFDSKPLHINALGIDSVVMPNALAGSVATLQKNIDDVRAKGGVPQLNHPNFGWALTAAEIKQLKNITLVEIFNGHPLVNNLGGGGSPSAEQIWDDVLSSGRVMYGIADDDSHYFKGPGDKTAPLPGQAWVYVRASELKPTAVLSALDRGDFYASTGVELEEYYADGSGIALKIKEQRGSKYRIEFIGRGGRVFAESAQSPATYRFKGNELYVRAKVYESNGKLAWTQPIFVNR